MSTKGQLLELVSPLHNATQRNCLKRMTDNKVEAMLVAKKYGVDYWDGNRRYGYGGYNYIPGRWRPVAQALIDRFGLVSGSRVLDVGCGKAYLLYEMQLINPDIELHGIDLSKHGLDSAPKDLNAKLMVHRAQDAYPWGDNFFDLVISLGTLHNLHLNEIDRALTEVERVGKNAYVMVESFRNEIEQFNLQCWALTAETLISVQSWEWLFEKVGYNGDYEFIYF